MSGVSVSGSTNGDLGCRYRRESPSCSRVECGLRVVRHQQTGQILRADRAVLDQRVEVDDLFPVLRAIQNEDDLLSSFWVCTSVRISMSSSSVPKPPGKTTSAFARYANQNLRMKK